MFGWPPPLPAAAVGCCRCHRAVLLLLLVISAGSSLMQSRIWWPGTATVSAVLRFKLSNRCCAWLCLPPYTFWPMWVLLMPFHV
jgi:hypothetical protein